VVDPHLRCKVVRVPQDWDNPLPSDVALILPGDSEPTILLSAQSEVEQARFDRPSPVATVIFCNKLKKAHEHLSSRGVLAGPVQDGATCSSLKSATLKGTRSKSAKNRKSPGQWAGNEHNACSRHQLNSYPRMKSLFRRLCSLATWSDMLAEPHQS